MVLEPPYSWPPAARWGFFDPFRRLLRLQFEAQWDFSDSFLVGAFAGMKLEEEFAGLAARRTKTTKRGGLLREISEWFWSGA